jgi:hypothetical protein
VTQKCLWRAVLIVVLSVVLATPVRANGFPSAAGFIAGAVAAGAAVVVIIVVVVHEASKTRRITGCVNSGENGMSLMDETDKRTYMLSGNTTDVKPGDRVTLQGKKVKPKDANKPLAWEVNKETKDFGACHP